MDPEAITMSHRCMELPLSNSLPILAHPYESGRVRQGVSQKWNRNTVCCGMLFRIGFALPPKGQTLQPLLATLACHQSWISRSGTAALSVVPFPGLD